MIIETEHLILRQYLSVCDTEKGMGAEQEIRIRRWQHEDYFKQKRI